MIIPAVEPAPADADGGLMTNPSDVPVPDRVPLELGVEGLEPCILVGLVRLEAPLHDLHVLLRHSPRSISPRSNRDPWATDGQRAIHHQPRLAGCVSGTNPHAACGKGDLPQLTAT